MLWTLILCDLGQSSSPYQLSLWTLTTNPRALSPVVPAPGVGQVGAGLQNAWGLEDEEDEEEEVDGDEPEVTIVAEKRGNKKKGESK